MEFKKKLSLFSLIFVSIIFSFSVISFISEKFFFDKIILNKSEKYGYSKDQPVYALLEVKPFSTHLEKRIADIRQLVDLSNNDFSAVLGTNSEENVYKVALIGDSFVYGMGVKVEDTIGYQLEKMLNTVRPTKVYNLALSGDSILDDYVKLKLAERYIQPDASIIVIVENDAYFDGVDRYPGGQEIYDEVSSLCPKPLKSFDYTNVFSEDDVINFVDYPSWSENFSNVCILTQIVERINERPNIFYMSLARKVDNEYIESSDPEDPQIKLSKMTNKYISIIENSGGKVVTPNFDMIYKSVSKMEGHSSPETNEIYANLIQKELVDNFKYKFLSL